MFSKYINPQIFFVSLCIGLFICYLIHPKPRVILKCPNPDNEDKITYKVIPIRDLRSEHHNKYR